MPYFNYWKYSHTTLHHSAHLHDMGGRSCRSCWDLLRMIFIAVWPQVSWLTPPLPSLHFRTWATSHGENLNQACASPRIPMQEGFVVGDCWVSQASAFPSQNLATHIHPFLTSHITWEALHRKGELHPISCNCHKKHAKIGAWFLTHIRASHCGLALGCPTWCGSHRLSAVRLKKWVILQASWVLSLG